MAHRDFTASLSGLALGLLIGAGAVFSAQGVTLEASAVSDARFHQAPQASDYRRREVDKKGVPLRDDDQRPNDFPTVKSDASTSTQGAGATAAMTTCDAVRSTVTSLKRTFGILVPNTLKNTEINQKMNAAFASAIIDACGVDAASSSSAAAQASSAAAVTVDNHCTQYAKKTVRFTQCVLAEQQGRTYP